MRAAGTALVTGASRGIGRAVALELARRGFEVLASMRDPAAGQELQEEARREGLALDRVELDVTRLGDFSPPAGLKVLVNNAGVDGENRAVEDTAPEQWRALFETNFFGLVEITRRAIPRLRDSGGGVVCNITSCSTLVPMPFFATYRASKAAVAALGESLRAELQPFGIRVLEVMPGAIDTDMFAASQPLPEASEHSAYRAHAEHVGIQRRQTAAAVTPAAAAARAIADAILDDDSPLRVACDPMGAGLLQAWRGQSDEEMMQGLLRGLCPDPPD
jgi:NAD(P)-dependent dehydrogenase (short-subunit alcohol dehydrogenase family)